MNRHLLGCTLILGLAPLMVPAEVQLPRILESNMVLQREQRVPVWGWAAPGEQVTVEFAGQSTRTTADPHGHWQVRLAPLMASSAPADLMVAGANRIVLPNVLVGEVWLCSGQSNMEKPITRCGH